ncbi:MAG: hypothetical protein E6005_07750 [Peptostreptococcus sp.]|nr:MULTISPECIES: hypothetical protein [Bacillota]MDU3434294.1 hypothetical protein [Veillonella sp.]MDU3454543.1 hypothetical protein [Peptostreptococcus sp.]MDU5681758.1 hypothetical protein [Peptostreptococcus sp.]MDU5738753.1 hypothetical protein [Peptostreptococcus sp.]
MDKLSEKISTVVVLLLIIGATVTFTSIFIAMIKAIWISYIL